MKKNIFLVIALYMCIVADAQNIKEDHYSTGMRFLYGISRPYNLPQAKMHLLLAVGESDPRALVQLAAIYTAAPYKNADSVRYWYNNAIEARAENAHFLLGRHYQLGTGMEQDFEKAARYYAQGAQAGEKYAKNALAYLHFKGLGVKQDYTIAFQLFLASAEDSLSNSMYFLGLCYRNGYGTVADQAKATYWLRKAAALGEEAAIHELTEEKLPENRSVVSPELQEQLQALQSSSEKYQADKNNNYEGIYEGVAVYYDWSGRYVTSILPLQLQLSKTARGYNGIWKEGESDPAPIVMQASNNRFSFSEDAAYVRKDHYSARKNEVWRFNNAGFQLGFRKDTIQLIGNVQFYSPARKEPGKPLQVILKRKMDLPIAARQASANLQLFPNPAGSYTNVRFELLQTTVIGIQVYSQAGVLVHSETQRTLPAGAYSLPLPTGKLKPGTYTVQLTTGRESQSKVLVKL